MGESIPLGLFPYSPQEITTQELRKALYENIQELRWLRNRIAHHEPIFTRNLQEDYDTTLKLIGWRDEATANWIERIQDVTSFIQNQPTQ